MTLMYLGPERADLDPDNMVRLFSFLIFGNGKFNGFALLQATIFFPSDCRIAYEDVGAIFLRDETAAFFSAEPFHRAGRAIFLIVQHDS